MKSCLIDNSLTTEEQMKNILVVDDDKESLALVKRILERAGNVVHCAESGEEALEKITATTFSLMITDLNMTGLDGLELSRKGLQIAPQMPIILNTGGISAEIIREANEIGIVTVLSKPFLAQELLLAIKDVMGKRLEWATS